MENLRPRIKQCYQLHNSMVDCNSEVISCLETTTSVLQDVYSEYHLINPTLNLVVEIHPHLGPLLTRLVNVPKFCSHHECCKVTIQMILWFFKIDETDKFQRRANRWVIEQLNTLLNNRDSTSCTVWDCQTVIKRNLDVAIKNGCLKNKAETAECLSYCAKFFNGKMMEEVIECVANLMAFEEVTFGPFFQTIHKRLQTGELQLSLQGSINLWKSSKLIFHWEIYQWMRKVTLQQSVTNSTIKHTDMFQACIKDPLICQQFISIMLKMTVKSAFHPNLLQCFEALNECLAANNSTVNSYPAHLQSLVGLLQLKVKNIPHGCRSSYLNNILKQLYFHCSVEENPLYEVKALITVFPQWMLQICSCILSPSQENSSHVLACNVIAILHDQCFCFKNVVKEIHKCQHDLQIENLASVVPTQDGCQFLCLIFIGVFVQLFLDSDTRSGLTIHFDRVFTKSKFILPWINRHLEGTLLTKC